MTRGRNRAPSPRQLRVGEEVRHALIEVLRRGGLRDPLLADADVTVSEVRMSPDLRAATAFVVPFGGGDAAALVEALNRAAPFLRGRIAQAVKLRLAPTLSFAVDRSFETAGRIEALLHDPAVARDLAAPDDDGAKGDDGPKGDDGA
jgi:ribosome-binding factor A